MTIDEVRNDLLHLKTIADGLTRKRDAIYILLTAIYLVRRKWLKNDVSRNFIDAILKEDHIFVDERAKKTGFRLLVEIACETDVKLKSRYASALCYAHQCGCSASELRHFIKCRGGIEATARKFRKKRNARLKRTTELVSGSRSL